MRVISKEDDQRNAASLVERFSIACLNQSIISLANNRISMISKHFEQCWHWSVLRPCIWLPETGPHWGLAAMGKYLFRRDAQYRLWTSSLDLKLISKCLLVTDLGNTVDA